MSPQNAEPPLRVVLFGCADLSKPRVRLLLDGLKGQGHEIIFCHRDIWSNHRDKSQINSLFNLSIIFVNWIGTLIYLTLKYMFIRKHDVVLVSYPGHADIWAARVVTWLKRKPLCWDAFLSAYNTIVTDRKMVSSTSLLGRITYFVDWAACRLSDHLFLDTPSHATYFEETFHLPPNSVGSVQVGSEDAFKIVPTQSKHNNTTFKIVFYGQFIPLHGIPTILEALHQLENYDINLTLIGQGQLSQLVEDWLTTKKPTNITHTPWIDYTQLPSVIASHHLGLGIFSSGEKADRVIPNKIYQMVALRLPIITRTSTAMKKFISIEKNGFTLVEPNNPKQLKIAILANYNHWKGGQLSPPSEKLIVDSVQVGFEIQRELRIACNLHSNQVTIR